MAGQKELKGRIDSVKNTMKITDAMKLVAAAKVRRAQDAVVNGRPFAENLVKVLALPRRDGTHANCALPACTLERYEGLMADHISHCVSDGSAARHPRVKDTCRR